MPRGDGTGPNGAGSRTGRGLGTCPPNVQNPSQNAPQRNVGGNVPRGGRRRRGNAGRNN